VQAAVTKLAPNYIPLARQANWAAIAATHMGPGQATVTSFPILFGPHHASYQTDWSGPTAKTPEGEVVRGGQRLGDEPTGNVD
jgi:hypothetical protein